MRRIGSVLVCAGLVLPAGAVLAGDDPPPLTAPALSGPVFEAPAERPPASPGTASPGPNAVLVLPGMTRSGPGLSARSVNSAQPSDVPVLVGPAGAAPARPSPDSPGDLDLPAPGRPTINLEPITEPLAEADVDPKPGAKPGRPDRPSARSPRPGRRPQRLFGRFFPPATEPRPGRDLGGSVKVEPRTDPAADAKLKRLVERQIRDTLGTRLRSYEVRVVGREVTVRARASRFWQRRAVRHTLETLPALTRTRANVELLD